jgi:hypothetical protein
MRRATHAEGTSTRRRTSVKGNVRCPLTRSESFHSRLNTGGNQCLLSGILWVPREKRQDRMDALKSCGQLSVVEVVDLHDGDAFCGELGGALHMSKESQHHRKMIWYGMGLGTVHCGIERSLDACLGQRALQRSPGRHLEDMVSS